MIRRQHRFHGLGSLRFVYNRGKTVRGPLCTLKYIVNSRQGSYRLAVVVSRKVNKSAVVRNRIRRRVYEAVRLHEEKITQPYDLVISVFHEELATMPADKLKSLVKSQLKQANII